MPYSRQDFARYMYEQYGITPDELEEIDEGNENEYDENEYDEDEYDEDEGDFSEDDVEDDLSDGADNGDEN